MAIENLEGEIWVPIYRHYQISNMGRVMSNKRKIPIILKPLKNNRGYHGIQVYVNGIMQYMTIHRLVAYIFLKNIDHLKTTVNHNNGKDDNRASSLCWMTQSENSKHAVENKMIRSGSSHYKSKLDETQVRVIRSLNNSGLRHQDIADYFKVFRSTIGRILSNKGYVYQ